MLRSAEEAVMLCSAEETAMLHFVGENWDAWLPQGRLSRSTLQG